MNEIERTFYLAVRAAVMAGIPVARVRELVDAATK